jgi:UDP-N-acetylglucosamine 4,6-dehydratase
MNAEALEHTNVGGTKAVIAACLEAGVARAVLVSSCEAAAPIGLVGATRLVAEELFVAANAYGGGAFAVVRAPHLARGRRSLFASLAPDHPQHARLRHHPRATQFVAGGEAVTEAVLTALGTALPGERLVPRARSASASSIAALFGTEDRLAEGGAVPTHERLVGPMEEPYTSIVGDLLRIRPAGSEAEGAGSASATTSAPASGPSSSPASAALAFQSNDRAALLPRAELRRFWAEELRASCRPS